MKKICVLIVLVLFSLPCSAEIEEWYKRDISQLLSKSFAVILYRTDSVALHSKYGPYYVYRIETTTLEVLKGAAPAGACYLIQTEGEWNNSNEIGEVSLVILARSYESKCGQIEPGFAAPGTAEYVKLYKTILSGGAQ